MNAIQISVNGGPEVLNLTAIPTPTVKDGVVIVQNSHVGVNFIDTYHRSGLYKLDLPAVLGRCVLRGFIFMVHVESLCWLVVGWCCQWVVSVRFLQWGYIDERSDCALIML